MRNMKLFPRGCRYRYKNYNQKVNAVERPNLLNQVFESSGHNKIWVGDITYISARKGTLYLAVFIIYSRKVVGWSMNNKMKDILVMDAFMQVYGKERPEKGLIVLHTDQGSQVRQEVA
ncbi:IS3 family transposase [Clostridium sp. DL-VIII]|uniref:IS3 family transposase n=1 Tax=Clostridium sp. DL-VIII TaxID=641107 RepID=UPI000682844A|nr:IS3 family transposase [Clostridium sp. DL-VIII]